MHKCRGILLQLSDGNKNLPQIEGVCAEPGKVDVYCGCEMWEIPILHQDHEVHYQNERG